MVEAEHLHIGSLVRELNIPSEISFGGPVSHGAEPEDDIDLNSHLSFVSNI